MSYTNNQLETILNLSADFDMAVSEGRWDDAKEVKEEMGSLGYEHEATLLLQSYNRAREAAGLPYGVDEFSDITYVPVGDGEIPDMTPDLDDAPTFHSHPEAGVTWRREGDEKFPEYDY